MTIYRALRAASTGMDRVRCCSASHVPRPPPVTLQIRSASTHHKPTSNASSHHLGAAAAAGIATIAVFMGCPTLAAAAQSEPGPLESAKQALASKAKEVVTDLRGAGSGAAPKLVDAPVDSLPPLPYPEDALEPHIDSKTMNVHYSRHHKTYVANLKGALEQAPNLAGMDLNELQRAVGTSAVPSAVAGKVRNNGGGHWNHSFFWNVMAPASSASTSYSESASPQLKAAIEAKFGTQNDMKLKFTNAALGLFGSGWTWLGVDPRGELIITTTPNQDNPLMEHVVESPAAPILGLDLWEHAYYLKHLNKKPEYVDDWWKVVNWSAVSDNYAAAKGSDA